jgi:hypothetical protein
MKPLAVTSAGYLVIPSVRDKLLCFPSRIPYHKVSSVIHHIAFVESVTGKEVKWCAQVSRCALLARESEHPRCPLFASSSPTPLVLLLYDYPKDGHQDLSRAMRNHMRSRFYHMRYEYMA